MHAIEIVLREIAVLTLPRVALKKDTGVVGIVVEHDESADKVLVHWGVQDRTVVRTWHSRNDLFWKKFTHLKGIHEKIGLEVPTNGHVPDAE